MSGRATREEVADWASTWVTMDNPQVADSVVWAGLHHLAGADLLSSPGEYLHHDIDFHAWLDELERAMDET